MFKVFGSKRKGPVFKRLYARIDGWDLHAYIVFAAGKRIAVERFCGYALRGPIANNRLKQGPRDKLIYRLKTPKPDGTTELVLSPMARLERLARLIPEPGRHMTRYFGVLSSGAAWARANHTESAEEAGACPPPPPAAGLGEPATTRVSGRGSYLRLRRNPAGDRLDRRRGGRAEDP